MPWTKIYKDRSVLPTEQHKMDDLQKHLAEYYKLCVELYDISKSHPLKNLQDMKTIIQNNILYNVKNYYGLSFSLTLLSRRLEGKVSTLPFDLASILLGPDSLLSYKKVIQNAYKSGMQDLQEFATEFIEDCCNNKKSVRSGIYYKNDNLNLVYSDTQNI